MGPGRRPQPRDPVEDAAEQLAGQRHRGHLEQEVTALGDSVGELHKPRRRLCCPRAAAYVVFGSGHNGWVPDVRNSAELRERRLQRSAAYLADSLLGLCRYPHGERLAWSHGNGLSSDGHGEPTSCGLLESSDSSGGCDAGFGAFITPRGTCCFTLRPICLCPARTDSRPSACCHLRPLHPRPRPALPRRGAVARLMVRSPGG